MRLVDGLDVKQTYKEITMNKKKNDESIYERAEGAFVDRTEKGRTVKLVKLQCVRCSKLTFVKTVLPDHIAESDAKTRENIETEAAKGDSYYNCGTCGKSDKVRIYPGYNMRKHDRDTI